MIRLPLRPAHPHEGRDFGLSYICRHCGRVPVWVEECPVVAQRARARVLVARAGLVLAVLALAAGAALAAPVVSGALLASVTR